jgi:hypothetical protein
MLSREIKDLAFALEALARVADASLQYSAVRELLQDKIDALRLEAYPSTPVAPAVNLDDDIPF